MASRSILEFPKQVTDLLAGSVDVNLRDILEMVLNPSLTI